MALYFSDVQGDLICQDNIVVAGLYQSAVARGPKLRLQKKYEPPPHRNDRSPANVLLR